MRHTALFALVFVVASVVATATAAAPAPAPRGRGPRPAGRPGAKPKPVGRPCPAGRPCPSPPPGKGKPGAKPGGKPGGRPGPPPKAACKNSYADSRCFDGAFSCQGDKANPKCCKGFHKDCCASFMRSCKKGPRPNPLPRAASTAAAAAAQRPASTGSRVMIFFCAAMAAVALAAVYKAGKSKGARETVVVMQVRAPPSLLSSCR